MDIVKQMVTEAIAEKMHPYIEAINGGEDIKYLYESDFTADEIAYAKSRLVKKSNSKDSYTWGLDCIDEKITTPKKGKVFVLVADENQGKSTFCYFLARGNYLKYKHRVVYFNLEQTKDEVINDMAIQYAGASKLQVRDNDHLAMPEYKKRKKELEDQEDIVFIGRKAENVTTMTEIRKRIADEKMDYLLLDNLTCIGGEGEANEKIKNTALELIGMAQSLNIPICLVHHYRKKSVKTVDIFRDVHEMEGSGALKNLVPMVIQVARNPEPSDQKEEDEFYIREGKLRGGARKETICVHHHKGDFIPDPSGNW